MFFKNVQWKYKFGDNFLNYDSDFNIKIEFVYQDNKKIVMVKQYDEFYEILFFVMIEMSLNGYSIEIKRVNLGGGELLNVCCLIELVEFWVIGVLELYII